jgi:toxin secretion/phage lysis holin
VFTAPTSAVKAKIAVIPGALLGFIWGLSPLVLALAVLQGLDFASGVLAAWGDGSVSSDAGRKGMVKKAQMWVLVGAVHMVCHVGIVPFDAGPHVAGLFCLVEVISIIENADRSGVKLPAFVVQALANARSKMEASADGK